MFTQPTNSCRIFLSSVSFYLRFIHFTSKSHFSCAFTHSSLFWFLFHQFITLTTIHLSLSLLHTRSHVQTLPHSRQCHIVFTVHVIFTITFPFHSNHQDKVLERKFFFRYLGIFLTLIKYAEVLNDINMLETKKNKHIYSTWYQAEMYSKSQTDTYKPIHLKWLTLQTKSFSLSSNRKCQKKTTKKRREEKNWSHRRKN